MSTTDKEKVAESKAEAKTLKAKTTFLKMNFNAIAHELKAITEQGRKIDDNADPGVVLLFKGMMNSIDDVYRRLTQTWEELLQVYILHDQETEFPTEAEKNIYANTKRYFYEAKAKLVEISEAARPSTNPEMTLNASQSIPARSRFPKLKLPTFSGKLSEWPIFRDNFTSLIHKDETISKMDKYHYLIGYLTDRALDVIKSIPLLENNYDLAWKTLSKTFDHKRTLASTYLNTLINFKPMTGKINPDILQNFLSIVPPNIAAFKNLKIDHPEEYIFFELAIRILDTQTREAFEMQNSSVDYPTFESLVDFVQDRMRALQHSTSETFKPSNVVETSKPPKSPKAFEPNRPQVSVLSANTSNNVKKAGLPTCKICNNTHRIAECSTLLQASPSERLVMLRNHRCCFNCLHPGQHTAADCKSARRCDQCQRRHHTLIHQAFADKSPPHTTKEKDTTSPTSSTSSTKPSVQLAAVDNANSVLLGTAVALGRDADGKYQPVRLVLDSGSQRSLITTRCAQRLGLISTPSPHQLVGVGQVKLTERLGQVNCIIKTDQPKRPLISAPCLVVSTITGDLPQTTLPGSILETFKSYKLADRTFGKPGPVDILLGADLYGDIVIGKPIRISPVDPTLLNTVFGHVLLGKYGTSNEATSTVLLNSCTDEINTTLKRFWAIEEPVSTKIVSPDDEWCENHFVETHQRLENGRYVTRLPFNGHQTSLGESRPQAMTRFLRLESTLSKNPIAKKSYDDFLREYLDLGHMTLAKTPGIYYLPHHAVKKMDDIEGKIRVVFDASAKTSTRSLNDCLHAGPKLQLDIADILLNFRRHKFVFTTDIKKMYRQILIDTSETKFQHILWRFRPDEEILDYELLTLTYGMSCAPFIALRVIKQLIEDEGPSYPRAAEVLKTDIYIDDVVTGASSFYDALDLIVQLIKLLRKGRFDLGKWSSNSSELLKRAGVTAEDSLVNLANNEDQTIKILGLQWNSTLDSFSYKIREPPPGITKRTILSTTARLYDPLGFLSPVIFTAKKILQDIWIAGSGWDEPPPSKVANHWTTFLAELPSLSEVDIPRFLRIDEKASYSLLGFSDASEIGYCAVLYLRVQVASHVNLFLLKAKTKLAPLKPSLSVPRLELLGAKLLTTLLTSISAFRAHLQSPKVFLFTDSMTVLSWLKTPSHLLKMYVAQRVNAILVDSEPTFWHHVRSKENPADIGSRGLMPSQIIDNGFWWNGPSWASGPLDRWPLQKLPTRPPEDLPDLKGDRVHVNVTTTDWDLESWTQRFSSYTRLIRSLCYVYRFLSRPRDKRTGAIDHSEFQKALSSYLAKLQTRFYADMDIQQRNLFNVLNVFQDASGIYRVGGRLKNANLPYEELHPILLPRRCHFNTLIVNYYHKVYNHVGPQTLMSLIRKIYWIPAGKNFVKKQSRSCHVCYKWSARPQPPYMGDLPGARTSENTVFHHVGVDFAGPLQCRESSRRRSPLVKSYICLFICFTTKAIHLEIAKDLSTEGFLDCLDRFIARRGTPAHMYSDCGTNFVGASRYLKEVEEWMNAQDTKTSLIDCAAVKGITWHFNPPRSPHFGGLWEAGVKSVKTLLFKTLGQQPFTEKELNTMVVKIEGLLTSRPLTPLSDDANDLQPLTPAHFLIGKTLKNYPDYDLTDEKEQLLSRWQYLRRKVQDFWSRWKTEYLQSLQPRKKWLRDPPNLQIGELVLVYDEKTPPFHWPLARVIEVQPGKDDIVRVATIKTQQGTYKRSVAKLVRLPFTQTSVPPQEN